MTRYAMPAKNRFHWLALATGPDRKSIAPEGSMSNATFPYQAWVLTPGFTAKEVSVTGKRWSSGSWLDTSSGTKESSELFKTRAAALKFGAQKLELAEARHARAAENLAKKRKTLEKQLA
jgi:hypothetical protein